MSHSFTVPATVDRAWATFMDLPLVGGCFPGATVTAVTDEGFAGTVKVKLGPISLVYSGTGAFVEKDDGAHRAVIEAKGKDKRGNGTAGATVTIQLTDVGDGSTRADVQTNLAVTGKPAQFGRGVMQDVSDKLLGQFVSCIEGKIGETPSPEALSTEAPSTEAPLSEAPSREPNLSEAPLTVAPEPAPEPAPAQPRHPGGTRPAPDDALDLGGTVLPVLVKTYGKQVLLGVVVVVAVIVIWRALS
nr:SRPBCC family protein [Pedococcus badiiscoriae]